MSSRSSLRCRARASARRLRTAWAAYRWARPARCSGVRAPPAAVPASPRASRAMASFSASSPSRRPADTPTTGTPSRRDSSARSTWRPSRAASSMRLTHTSTRPVSSSTCRARMRLRSRQVASHTSTTPSARPLEMYSQATCSSGVLAVRE